MINGSLWTIPIECSFYIVLPVAALLFGLRRSTVPLFLLSLGAFPLAQRLGLSEAAPGPALLTNVHAFPFIDLSSYFLAGSAAWMMRDRIPFSRSLLALSLIGLYAAQAALSGLALKLLLPYLVRYAAMVGGLGSRFKRAVGDLSYGTYLFGFPVTLPVMAVDGGRSTRPSLSPSQSPWPASGCPGTAPSSPARVSSREFRRVIVDAGRVFLTILKSEWYRMAQ